MTFPSTDSQQEVPAFKTMPRVKVPIVIESPGHLTATLPDGRILRETSATILTVLCLNMGYDVDMMP